MSPQDELCGAFWRLVLAQRWMGRLKTVAGSQMQNLLDAVNTEIQFVTSCAFQVSPELGGQVRGARCLPRAWEVKLTSALPEISFDRNNSREVELEPQSHWGPGCWGIILPGHQRMVRGLGPMHNPDVFLRPCGKALLKGSLP